MNHTLVRLFGLCSSMQSDEIFTGFLDCALMNLWACSAPLRETLPVMEAIQASVPKMRAIWANSMDGMLGHRDASLDSVMESVPIVKEKLATGKYKLDDCIKV
jgi:hypothetical protein